MSGWIYAALLVVSGVGFGLAFTVEPGAINMAVGALCFIAFMGFLDLIERWL